MEIFIVTATHFSQESAVISYHASEREAHIAATERVNWLRADLDPEILPPVDVCSWQLGLAGAQLLQLEVFGFKAAESDRSGLADTTGLDVRIEKAQLPGVSVPTLDDRELSTILAALRDHQRRHCAPDLADVASNLNRHEPLTSDEIDGLCERLNCGIAPAQEVNIVVELDGGLVEGVVADRPTKVRVVDYDVEGADPADLALIPQDHGDPIPASVSGWAVESACIDPEWIASLDAASAADGRAAALMVGE
ncbi:MAG: hypothetical protein ACR2PC_08030 [Tsuneonella suprasediminis]